MFRIQYALGAALLAAALGLAAPQAKAQQSYKGTFHLPFETYWAGTVLEPGEYTVTLEGGPVSLLKVHGSGVSTTILAGPVDLTEVSAHGRMTLVNVDGTYALRQFDAGMAGKSFSFAVPKTIRVRAAQGGEPTTRETVVTIQEGSHEL
jgi:hypothetical protein